jgi:Family of unknown function (DUF5318)
VEPRGLEPLTPCLQSKCAANCAMAPGSRGPIPESGPADPRWYATVPGPTNSQNRPRAEPRNAAARSGQAGSSRSGAILRKIAWGRRRGQSPRTLLPMWSQREVIDYALQRRSTLQALRRPGRRLARQEACDADPMLIRAAKHHGEPSNVNCPVCESDGLVNLHYVFGDQLGQYSGRIKRTTELEEMAHAFGEFKVVVVEVCPACGWNHMILSYLLGDGVKRKPPRRQQTVEDIYG